MKEKSEVWLRLPIKVISTVEKHSFELMNQEPPEDYYEDSWIDIIKDGIVAIRPNTAENSEVTSSIIYTTSGESFIIEMLPETLKTYIGYNLIKFEKC